LSSQKFGFVSSIGSERFAIIAPISQHLTDCLFGSFSVVEIFEAIEMPRFFDKNTDVWRSFLN
jgi:hypothetical protein